MRRQVAVLYFRSFVDKTGAFKCNCCCCRLKKQWEKYDLMCAYDIYSVLLDVIEQEVK